MNIHIKNCYIKKYVWKNLFYGASKKHVIPLWRNAGDSVEINTANAKLAFSYIKKYQALVLRGRLKRMSCKAVNMTHELETKELKHTTQRHITSVTSSDVQR